jgi:glycosyltransferase involved in cell wall biosynthesis
MCKKLAIISTHPIQYYAPVFALLAAKVELKVFYTQGTDTTNRFDYGFGRNIEWDIPLLQGYEYEFVNNIAKKPGTHHFSGIQNPDAIKKISDYNPDSILVYGWAYQSHLKIIRYFKGKIPIYFRGDSTVLNMANSLRGLFKKLLLTWVYRHIDVAFYVGSANKAYFKTYGLKEEQLIFAPHAIDNSRFSSNHLKGAKAIRGKFGILDDAILVLFAGKLEPVKNPELLLKAFIELSLPNVHLLFVGNGILEEKLKAESRKVKAESEKRKAESLSFNYAQDDNHNPDDNQGNIHFMDFQNQSQMPIVYQACDLFCLPSKSESWGLAVNEAMAAGKAILVSDQVGCAADLVKDRYNGAIFKSRSLPDLIKQLSLLCKSKSQLKTYGDYSREIINNWSFNNQVQSIKLELSKNATE